MAEPSSKNGLSRSRADASRGVGTESLSSLAALVRNQILLDRRCHFMTRSDAVSRIRSDYLELPGLRLTAPQAARLWSLERDLASDLLEELVERKFLERSGEQYCLRQRLPPPEQLQRQHEADREPSHKGAELGGELEERGALEHVGAQRIDDSG